MMKDLYFKAKIRIYIDPKFSDEPEVFSFESDLGIRANNGNSAFHKAEEITELLAKTLCADSFEVCGLSEL